jgi:DNA-binding NarL/FixJ family response regulator
MRYNAPCRLWLDEKQCSARMNRRGVISFFANTAAVHRARPIAAINRNRTQILHFIAQGLDNAVIARRVVLTGKAAATRSATC